MCSRVSRGEIGALADQFEFKTKGRVERFTASKAEYLKVSGYAFDQQGDMRGVCVQHVSNSNRYTVNRRMVRVERRAYNRLAAGGDQIRISLRGAGISDCFVRYIFLR